MLPTTAASTRAFRGAVHHVPLSPTPSPSRLLGGRSAGSGRWGWKRRWVEQRASLATSHGRHQAITVAAESSSPVEGLTRIIQTASDRTNDVPQLCPGCGALSHTLDPDAPGFYGSRRVERALRGTAEQEEDRIFQQILQSGALSSGPPTPPSSVPDNAASTTAPMCDRCHYLLHQSRGTSIVHPTMHSIRQMIEESPHAHNHIYHVLDAADFPLSLIPNLTSALNLPRLRTQNRRSKQQRYTHGRIADVSFVITRADLLAPQKEQADRLLPTLKEILRDALGRTGKNVRMGNVRCVSAQRGWWTPVVKEEIWKRGGAAWMVGKANVGKSALFEVVFPKGRGGKDVNVKRMRAEELERQNEGGDVHGTASVVDEVAAADIVDEAETTGETKDGDDAFDQAGETTNEVALDVDTFGDSPGELSERLYLDGHFEPAPETIKDDSASLSIISQDFDSINTSDTSNDLLPETSLLPPPHPPTPYPTMPLISALPGTTALPIRIPFGPRDAGNELIDLPGIQRSTLSTHVLTSQHKTLVMHARPKPEQASIKPGQSLLLGGGVLRVVPQTEDLVFLAYAFTPIDAHVTSHAKASAIQTGVDADGMPYAGTVPSILTEEGKKRISSAGVFQLEWDVTRTRAGPLTSPVAGKMRAANLPFVVYAADILVEGVGWLELVCQVRRRGMRSSPPPPPPPSHSPPLPSPPLPPAAEGSSAFTPFASSAPATPHDRPTAASHAHSSAPAIPSVEIFSPLGKFVGIRRPINAWVVAGEGGKKAAHKVRGRPRMSVGFQRRKLGGARGR